MVQHFKSKRFPNLVLFNGSALSRKIAVEPTEEWIQISERQVCNIFFNMKSIENHFCLKSRYAPVLLLYLHRQGPTCWCWHTSLGRRWWGRCRVCRRRHGEPPSSYSTGHAPDPVAARRYIMFVWITKFFLLQLLFSGKFDNFFFKYLISIVFQQTISKLHKIWLSN